MRLSILRDQTTCTAIANVARLHCHGLRYAGVHKHLHNAGMSACVHAKQGLVRVPDSPWREAKCCWRQARQERRTAEMTLICILKRESRGRRSLRDSDFRPDFMTKPQLAPFAARGPCCGYGSALVPCSRGRYPRREIGSPPPAAAASVRGGPARRENHAKNGRRAKSRAQTGDFSTAITGTIVRGPVPAARAPKK